MILLLLGEVSVYDTGCSSIEEDRPAFMIKGWMGKKVVRIFPQLGWQSCELFENFIETRQQPRLWRDGSVGQPWELSGLSSRCPKTQCYVFMLIHAPMT